MIASTAARSLSSNDGAGPACADLAATAGSGGARPLVMLTLEASLVLVSLETLEPARTGSRVSGARGLLCRKLEAAAAPLAVRPATSVSVLSSSLASMAASAHAWSASDAKLVLLLVGVVGVGGRRSSEFEGLCAPGGRRSGEFEGLCAPI